MAEQVNAKSSNKALIITGIVIGLFVIGLVTNGFGLFNKSITGNVINEGEIPLTVGNSPVLGSETAPLKVYIFSDFSCPYCGAAAGENQQVISQLQARDPTWEAPVPNIIKDYVETGKVQLVFKSFPGHGTGGAAHEVGWCLSDQNLFWEFHDRAFASQEDTGSLSKMKQIAEELGADMNSLNECLDSEKYNYLFQKDQLMGQSNGVRATPTFIVGDQIVEGAHSYNTLKGIIENKLQ